MYPLGNGWEASAWPLSEAGQRRVFEGLVSWLDFFLFSFVLPSVLPGAYLVCMHIYINPFSASPK